MKIRRAMLFPALALVAALACAGEARAQKEDWQSKPYQQWAMKDVQKVLGDSPWSQQYVRSAASIDSRSAGVMASKGYVVRLRSALPVRQGLLRLRQLREKYDSMNDKKKAEFDEKNKALIECPPCEENYVVAMLPAADSDKLPEQLYQASLERVKPYVRLVNDRGQQRELVHFAPSKSGSEVTFFFPKFDDKGAPLVTPETKRLVLIVEPGALGGDATINRFEFDVSKMLVDGKLVL